MPKTKKPSGADIYEFRKSNPKLSWKDVVEHFGENYEALRKRERRWRQSEGDISAIGKLEPENDSDLPPKRTNKTVFKESGQSATAYSVSHRIKSLEELVAACSADLDKWQVTRYMVNVWEMGRKKKVVDLIWNNGVMDGFVEDTGLWQLTDLWQVKAWFEPRKEQPYEKALEELIQRIKEYSPRYKHSSFAYRPIKDGYLAVPNLYDAHFGKRAHRSIQYTLQEAKEDFIQIADSIAAQLAGGTKSVEKVLFPIGHDILHVDSLLDQTSGGRWVEESEDVRLAIDAATEASISAAEVFATVAPVVIVPIEGNHSRLQTYWLGKVLDAFFRNHPNITVQGAALERQYFQWGKVGIGMTHDGSKPSDLANLFPIEARYMWPDIEWTEWLTGHFHHSRGALYAVDSIRGTVIRTIAGLCNLDNYHSLHLYVGTRRAAEVLYYHKENGPAGSFPVFVSELSKKEM